MNGSWERVSWAFRVGLNQTAGSLGGATSPGYFRTVYRKAYNTFPSGQSHTSLPSYLDW